MSEQGFNDLFFQGINQPVRLLNCEALIADIYDFFPTWPCRIEKASSFFEPAIKISKTGRHYRVEAPWLEEPLDEETEVCLLCGLAVDLVNAYLRANPEYLGLHCAAADFSDRLVLFPNTNQSGKSTLAVRLMAAGITIYADDLLAIDPQGQGMSFGIRPRLRLPLPQMESALLRFVAANAGIQDGRYCYLKNTIPRLASFGQKKPIGAFVVPIRQKEGQAKLKMIPGTHGLQRVIERSLMHPGTAQMVLFRSRVLTEICPCWYLYYSNLDEAADLLIRSFAPQGPGWSRSAAPVNFKQPSLFKEKRRGRAAIFARRPSRINFIRNPDLEGLEAEGDLFLLHKAKDAIFYLNPLGKAVWELLAEPLNERMASRMLGSFFPQTPRRKIENDLMRLFSELKDAGLIRPARSASDRGSD